MVTIDYKPSGKPHPCMAEFALLGELLDAPVRSRTDLAGLASERVSVVVMDRLADRGFKADELSFIIPRRTLAHRRLRHERLSTEESDKAIRLAKIVAQATSVFGSVAKAMAWLRGSRQLFGGKSALDFLGTEHGARVVEEVLVQADEGYFG